MSELVTTINTGFAEINYELSGIAERLGNVATVAATATKKITTTTAAAVASVEETSAAAGAGFGTGLALVAGAFATIALEHLKGTLEEAQNYAEQLHVLAAVSGNTEGQLQKLFYALGQTGVNANTAQYAMSIMAKRIEQAAVNAKDLNNPIIALGLNAKQMVTEDTITQFEQISDAMRGLKDRTEQVAIATELFGGRTGGARMLPFLLEGTKGMQELFSKFKPIDPAVEEGFLKLAFAANGLRQSLEALKEEILAPIAGFLERATHAAEAFINKLRDLSPSDKLAILVGTLGSIVVAFEVLLDVVGRFLAESVFLRTLIDIVKVFGVELRVIGIIATVIAASWKSNFAGIRDATLEVFNAIKGEAGRFGTFWTSLVDTFKSKVGPAFDALSKSLSVIVKNLADTITALLTSKTTWDLIADAAYAITTAITTLIGFLTFLTDNFKTVSDVMVAVFITRGVLAIIPALAAAGTAIMGFIGELIALAFTAGIQGVDALTLLSRSLVQAAAQIDLTIPEIFLISLALVEAYRIMQDNGGPQGLVDNLNNIGTYITVTFFGMLSNLITQLATLWQAFADLVHYVPFFGSAMQSDADALRKLADQAEETKEHILGVWEAQQKLSEWGPGSSSVGHYGGPTAAKKKESPGGGGTAELPSTEKGGKAKDTFSTDFLAPLKLRIDALKEALFEADEQTKQLKNDLKAMGEIDTPGKFAAAMGLYKEQVAQANANHKLLGNILIDLNAELSLANQKMQSGNLALKDRITLQREIFSIEHEIAATRTEYNALGVTYVELEKEAADVAKQHFALIYDDTTKTWPERLAAVSAYRDALISIYGYDAARLDVNKELAKLMKEQADDARSLQKATGELRVAEGKLATSESHGGGSQDTKLQEAMQKAADATQAYNDAQQAVFGMLASGVSSGHDFVAAVVAETHALAAELSARAELNNAEYAASHQFDTELLKLAQHVGGPVFTIFQQLANLMRGAVVNLQSLGIALLQAFEQTQAFADIQTAVKEILTQVAAVLEKLRPVVDLLLGVLIGVVNAFLILIDILTLGLAHIRLLNSNLQQLTNTTTSLITIVHNLPTMNQANQGVMGNLSIQQQKANSILTGMYATMAKIGEIIGLVLGALLIMKIIELIANVLHGITIVQHLGTNILLAQANTWLGGIWAGVGYIASLLGGGLFVSAGTTAAAIESGAVAVSTLIAHAPVALSNVFSPTVSGGGGGSSGGDMHIHIENIHGVDPATVRSQLGPVFDEMLQKFNDKQARFTRSSNYSYGRFGH